MASSDDEGSVRSCIEVAVLAEDLTSACTADCTPERCDNAVVRPHEPPSLERGTPGQFDPLDVPHREATIRDLPESPMRLFQRYIPYEMAESWAKWTNEAPAPGPVQR
ncbi:hypothetical protein CMUS01_06577, partial [Colletotrichum musicola]